MPRRKITGHKRHRKRGGSPPASRQTALDGIDATTSAGPSSASENEDMEVNHDINNNINHNIDVETVNNNDRVGNHNNNIADGSDDEVDDQTVNGDEDESLSLIIRDPFDEDVFMDTTSSSIPATTTRRECPPAPDVRASKKAKGLKKRRPETPSKTKVDRNTPSLVRQVPQAAAGVAAPGPATGGPAVHVNAAAGPSTATPTRASTLPPACIAFITPPEQIMRNIPTPTTRVFREAIAPRHNEAPGFRPGFVGDRSLNNPFAWPRCPAKPGLPCCVFDLGSTRYCADCGQRLPGAN